jgi:hypothetical protein
LFPSETTPLDEQFNSLSNLVTIFKTIGIIFLESKLSALESIVFVFFPSPQLCPPTPPRRNAAEQQIVMLQQQLHHYQEEIVALRRRNSQEFDMGFHHGRSQGFEDAMQLSAPATYKRPDPRGRIPYRTDNNDEDTQRAIHASRHETRRGYATETPGAGPSRAPSRSAPHPMTSSQPWAQAPPIAPLAPIAPVSTNATATPDHHDYELAIIIRENNNFPDPANTKWPGFACIPLPYGYRFVGPNLISIHGPARPPRLEDALPYLEMWAAFANGRTVPDPFHRFFNTGVHLDTRWLRNTVHGIV